MRKFLCVLTCVCLLFCPSCADKKADPVTTGFRCRIRTEYEGFAIEAVLDRREESQTIVEFEAPKELHSLRLVFKNGELKLEFSGISFDIPDAYQTETMLLSTMLTALDDLTTQQCATDSRFVFDEYGGMPLSFTDGVTVYFSDWETQRY